VPWCRSRGFQSLKQVGVDDLTQFRTTWKDAPISKYKKQERLKGSSISTLRATGCAPTRSRRSSPLR
jgi:hypothetical protein